jgi:hypothetical protein
MRLELGFLDTIKLILYFVLGNRLRYNILINRICLVPLKLFEFYLLSPFHFFSFITFYHILLHVITFYHILSPFIFLSFRYVKTGSLWQWWWTGSSCGSSSS